MAKSSRSRSQKSRLKPKPSRAWSAPDQVLLEEALGLHQSGELRQAEQKYKKLLVSFPDHLAVNDGLGLVSHQLGENDRAARYFKKAAEQSHGQPEYLNKYGFVLWRAGQLDEAQSVFEELVQYTPDFVQGYINLDNVYLELKRNEASLEAFNSALAIAPNNLEALNNSARALKDLGSPTNQSEDGRCMTPKMRAELQARLRAKMSLVFIRQRRGEASNTA